MPIPSPNKGEKKDAFVSRCISSIVDEYGQDKAAGICYTRWNNRKKKVNKSAAVEAAGHGLSINPDVMTRDQAVVAKVVLDNLIGMVCGCGFAKAEGKTVPGESILRSMFYVEWGNGEEKAITAALTKLEAGSGKFTKRELAAISGLIDKTLQGEFVDPVAGQMPSILTRWYKKAKKSVTSTHGLDMMWDTIDDRATEWLYDHHMYWVKGYYNKHLSTALSAHVADAMKEGLGRQAIGEELKRFFDGYPGVRNQPLHYWRGFAANGMNRTRQFGLLQSWQDVGITQLEVMAVMDERTSSICKRMNGEIIPIDMGIGQRDLLMAADDPEDVKTIAPWPKLEDIEDKKIKAIMDQGVITPPYHFNCRTTLVER